MRRSRPRGSLSPCSRNAAIEMELGVLQDACRRCAVEQRQRLAPAILLRIQEPERRQHIGVTGNSRTAVSSTRCADDAAEHAHPAGALQQAPAAKRSRLHDRAVARTRPQSGWRPQAR